MIFIPSHSEHARPPGHQLSETSTGEDDDIGEIYSQAGSYAEVANYKCSPMSSSPQELARIGLRSPISVSARKGPRIPLW